jgi:nitroreductase
MDTVTAIRSRRSVRRYAARPVGRNLIEEVVRDAAQAPTTPVSEAWMFTVVRGAARVAGYGERALAFARAHRPEGPGFDWVDRADFAVFHGAPVAIVISAPGENAQSVQDCTRAGQNLMLSAHARGLGTCWVGSPLLWLRDPAVRAELGIPPPFLPFAAFALGFPAGAPEGRPQPLPTIVWLDDEAPASVR